MMDDVERLAKEFHRLWVRRDSDMSAFSSMAQHVIAQQPARLEGVEEVAKFLAVIGENTWDNLPETENCLQEYQYTCRDDLRKTARAIIERYGALPGPYAAETAGERIDLMEKLNRAVARVHELENAPPTGLAAEQAAVIQAADEWERGSKLGYFISASDRLQNAVRALRATEPKPDPRLDIVRRELACHRSADATEMATNILAKLDAAGSAP